MMYRICQKALDRVYHVGSLHKLKKFGFNSSFLRKRGLYKVLMGSLRRSALLMLVFLSVPCLILLFPVRH